jgi:hypothetical protein
VVCAPFVKLANEQEQLNRQDSQRRMPRKGVGRGWLWFDRGNQLFLRKRSLKADRSQRRRLSPRVALCLQRKIGDWQR